MQTHSLVPHPAFEPGTVEKVTVRWGPIGNRQVMLRFRVDGCDQMVVPQPNGNGRCDELWKTTCFELFLARSGGQYREFNFSPSGQWAAYGFSGYRTRRSDFDPAVRPMITVSNGRKIFTLAVMLDKAEFTGVERVSLCAVIEERRKRLSYWAARHLDLKPDFHNPACFVLPVAPARRHEIRDRPPASRARTAQDA